MEMSDAWRRLILAITYTYTSGPRDDVTASGTAQKNLLLGLVCLVLPTTIGTAWLVAGRRGADKPSSSAKGDRHVPGLWLFPMQEVRSRDQGQGVLGLQETSRQVHVQAGKQEDVADR